MQQHSFFIMLIELSGVQFGLKSYAWFPNQTSVQHKFDLKSQVWFQTKIARHEVQLPLYYTHFEITQVFVCTLLFKLKDVLFPLFYVIPEIHRFLHRGKAEIAKSLPPTMTFFALYFYAIWLAYAIKPWNVIDSIISFSLAKKNDAI